MTTCAGSHVAIGARDDQHYVVDLRDGARVGTIGPSHRVFCRRFPARAGRAARGYFEVSYSEGHLGGSFGVWAHDGRPLAPMQFGWSEPRELDGVELIALPYFGATLYVGLDGVRYFEGLPTPGRYPELAERELAEAELRPLSTAALEERWLELLARHGYLVPEARRAEFLAQDWYRPTWDKRAAEPSASALSPIERANYELLERALASRRR
ncbi:MAG: hypothetical protein KC468_14885 [Myxococcales bacterium]|nr:hypothetical protein [Myxococcales bacterium]